MDTTAAANIPSDRAGGCPASRRTTTRSSSALGLRATAGEGRPQVLSAGTVALAWEPLEEGCHGDHFGYLPQAEPNTPPPAVVTGTHTSSGAVAAYCLDCAATQGDDFVPHCPEKVVPTVAELDHARQLAKWRRGEGRTLTEEQSRVAAVTGLPRPMGTVEIYGSNLDDEDETTARRLPIPWINGHHGVEGDFFSFREECSLAFEDQLCCVCGDKLGAVVAIAAADGKRHTSGGWGHPRCIQLTVATCPHFTEATFETVAWAWDGEGVGVLRPEYEDRDVIEDGAAPLGREALRAWARADPWGEQGPSMPPAASPGPVSAGCASRGIPERAGR